MIPDGWNVPIIPIIDPATVMPPIVPVPGRILPLPSEPPASSDIPTKSQVETAQSQIATLQAQVAYLLANPSRGTGGPRAASFYYEGTLITGKQFGRFTFTAAATVSRIEAELRECPVGSGCSFAAYVNGSSVSGLTVSVAADSSSGTTLGLSGSIAKDAVVTIICTSEGSTFPGAGAFINIYYE